MFFYGSISFITAFLTDGLLLIFLTLSGVFLSIKTRFVQIRYLGEGLKNTFGGLFSKKKANREISPFAALTCALAAQLGTGNIVGAGSAIITGGPGAVFWMWLSAFFGMATAYSEAVLSQKTKIRASDGTYTGGAAYYIRAAFREKTGIFLASLFSVFATTALGFTGTAVQSNSISVSLNEATGIPVAVTGIIITCLAGLFLIKGTSFVARLSEKTIPVMTVLYIAVCITVIAVNIKYLPSAIYSIFAGAFSPQAVGGGLTGITVKTAVSQGIKRGLFTNEAGMGSAPSAHALSDAPSPHYQGTLGVSGVFIDTFLMLSLTAFSVITVFCKNGFPQTAGITGSEAVAAAFGTILGKKGGALFTAVSVMLFAFASILGWHISGKASCIYLFGEKSSKIYYFSSLFFVFAGACFPAGIIWTLTDIFNAFMVIVNIPALIRLSDGITECIPRQQTLSDMKKYIVRQNYIL